MKRPKIAMLAAIGVLLAVLLMAVAVRSGRGSSPTIPFDGFPTIEQPVDDGAYVAETSDRKPTSASGESAPVGDSGTASSTASVSDTSDPTSEATPQPDVETDDPAVPQDPPGGTQVQPPPGGRTPPEGPPEGSGDLQPPDDGTRPPPNEPPGGFRP
jgi:hypothetical protein